MSVHIFNYTEICSLSLSSLVDVMDIQPVNGKIFIDMRKSEVKEVLEYYLKSFVCSQYHFGYRNVMLGTCRPFDNWRKNERGASIRASKYALTEPENFDIDANSLEIFLDRKFKSISKQSNMCFISMPELDYFDMVMLMKEALPHVTVHPTHYYFLRDMNNDYMHTMEFPDTIRTNLEIKMRQNKLIL